MIVTQIADSGHNLDPALFHAPQGEQAVGDGLQAIGTATKHDNFEAQIMIDVNMQRGAHLLAELVLKVGQLLAEVAHVVVVDQGERGDGVHGLGHLGAPHFGAGQIAKQLRARASARTHYRVEIAQQRAFECNPETNQRIFHPC